MSNYTETGYLKPELIETVISTLYSNPLTSGGRLFIQTIMLKDGTTVVHHGNTSSTAGVFSGSKRVEEKVKVREIKDIIKKSENIVRY